MDTLLTAKSRILARGGNGNQVTVVAASEDSTTSARAEEFCNGLARLLGTAYTLNKQMWPLSELRLAQLRSIAAADAARADMIIVSVRHSEALPADLASWIEEWVHHKHKRVQVLLGQFDPVHQGVSTAIRAHLAEVARKAHVEFLAQSEETVAEV